MAQTGPAQSSQDAWKKLIEDIRITTYNNNTYSLLKSLQPYFFKNENYIWETEVVEMEGKPNVKKKMGNTYSTRDSFEYNFVKQYISLMENEDEKCFHVQLKVKRNPNFSTRTGKPSGNIAIKEILNFLNVDDVNINEEAVIGKDISPEYSYVHLVFSRKDFNMGDKKYWAGELKLGHPFVRILRSKKLYMYFTCKEYEHPAYDVDDEDGTKQIILKDAYNGCYSDIEEKGCVWCQKMNFLFPEKKGRTKLVETRVTKNYVEDSYEKTMCYRMGLAVQYMLGIMRDFDLHTDRWLTLYKIRENKLPDILYSTFDGNVKSLRSKQDYIND